MGPTTKIQVYSFETKDRLFEVCSELNIEKRYSKIELLIHDTETGKITDTVRYKANADDFKLICWDILTQNFSEWTDTKGHNPGNGEFHARTVCIRKDVKYRQPYVIKIDNGAGEAIGAGVVKMVKAEGSATILLPEWDMRKMAQTVLDHIHSWETIHFKARLEAMVFVVPASEQA